MFDTSVLKDVNFFTNKLYNKLILELSLANNKAELNLFEMGNYLEKYQSDFYLRNEKTFLDITINEKNELLLFYPFHRVNVNIMSKFFLFFLLSDFKNRLNQEDIEDLVDLLNNLNTNDIKQIEKELIHNEFHLITKLFKSKLNKCNNAGKINLINNFIKLLQNILQEQINLSYSLESKCNITNCLNDSKTLINQVEIFTNLTHTFDNLLNNGLLKVIKSLEQQKHKIHNSKNYIELGSASQIPDERKLSIQPKLQNIKVQRQLINVLMLSYYKALDNEIKSQKAFYKNQQINQSSLIESLLNYFDYDGDIYSLKKSVQNFNIKDVDLGHITEIENKQLCNDLKEYIKTKEYYFMKMLKFRKINMANL